MIKYTISKYCPDCKTIKFATEFHKALSRSDGLYNYCKSCTREQSKARYIKYKEKYKIATRNRSIKRIFNIEPSEYRERLAEQNNLCFICGNPETSKYKGKTKLLGIDHDHLTGRVRKLLCHNCNLMLGYSKDDPNVLRKAADYVEEHKNFLT